MSKARYESEIRTNLQQQFNYTNSMCIPKLKAIHLNMGVGRHTVANTKFIEFAEQQLTLIAGQKAVRTIAKKSNAGFKIRQFMPMGVKVTLRGEQMYNFLDKLVVIALPRQRDFRG
ncbi:MAG: 50S ribosomal protein L5, partial [Pseudomonadota bacterium]